MSEPGGGDEVAVLKEKLQEAQERNLQFASDLEEARRLGQELHFRIEQLEKENARLTGLLLHPKNGDT